MIRPEKPNENFNFSWLLEMNLMSAKQKLTEALENEAISMMKVEHPAYFRRRFLKSKLIHEEVNELRADESANKNHAYIEKIYGTNLVDENGMLNKEVFL